MASDREHPLGDDPEMTQLLRTELPRHPAPADLRAVVVRLLAPPPRRARWTPWLAPTLSALAAAAVVVLWMASFLPTPAPDPVQALARAAVTEHARAVTWGGSQPEVVAATLPRIMDESGIVLSWVFTGDDDIQLVDAHPTYVEGHRALALGYQDADGHAVSYMAMPGGSIVLPDRGRAQVDRWRPLVRNEDGFSLIMWKQQGLLCIIVSDLVSEDDLARLKEYFVKIRSSTEVAPTS